MILIPPQKNITYIYEYWKIGKSCALASFFDKEQALDRGNFVDFYWVDRPAEKVLERNLLENKFKCSKTHKNSLSY
jgi:hypothetical protein